MNEFILRTFIPTLGVKVGKTAGNLIGAPTSGTIGIGVREAIPVNGGTIPGVVVTPNGSYPSEENNNQPIIFDEHPIIIDEVPNIGNIYDRIENPNKPKTYYASVDKMQVGGQINPETDFRDDLTMPVATGDRAERIMNRIDRRANRAVRRIEDGRMDVRRGDILGNQYAKDLGRLNEINSVRGDLHLPGSRRNAREAVSNYLNSIGMNEVEHLPKYPGHY